MNSRPVASRINFHKGLVVNPLFGVLSSGEQWRFYTYDPTPTEGAFSPKAKFLQSQDFFLRPVIKDDPETPESPSEADIRQLADPLFWLLLDSVVRGSIQYLTHVEHGMF